MKRFKIALILLLSIVALFGIWYGFDKETRVINKITTEYFTYIVANYEKTVYEYDVLEGEHDWHTERWDRLVSPVNYVSTTNGVLGEYNCKKEDIINEYRCVPPEIDNPIKGENFVSYNTERELTIIVFYEGTDDYNFISEGLYKKALSLLNKKIQVKTWYGINYSTDL